MTEEAQKCQYAADIGMPEYRCAKECQYALAEGFGPIDGNGLNTALENWFPLSADELVQLREQVRLLHETNRAAQVKRAEAEKRALVAEARALAMEKDAGRWKEKARLQRRELRRLNKVLGPYWAGFRKGLGMEAEGKLRLTMIQAFGSEKVRAAEHAAIDASRARAK